MRVLRLNDVSIKTGLAKSTIYKYIDLGIFPKSIRLTEKTVGWIEAEIEAWIVKKILERDRSTCA